MHTQTKRVTQNKMMALYESSKPHERGCWNILNDKQHCQCIQQPETTPVAVVQLHAYQWNVVLLMLSHLQLVYLHSLFKINSLLSCPLKCHCLILANFNIQVSPFTNPVEFIHTSLVPALCSIPAVALPNDSSTFFYRSACNHCHTYFTCHIVVTSIK